LEGDRGAALMQQAARRGAIDFRRADAYDRSWQYLLHQGLRDTHRQLRLEYLHAAHRHHLAGAQVLSPDGAKESWRLAGETLDRIHACLFPWEAGSEEKQQQRRQTESRQMLDTWEARYGAMGSPEVLERIAATVAALEAATARR
jgi:hypothetical protein